TGSLQAELVALGITELVVDVRPRSPVLVDQAHQLGAESDDAVLLRVELLTCRPATGRGADVEMQPIAARLRTVRVVEEQSRADPFRIFGHAAAGQVLLGEAR